jgi:DNA polymerase III epsilon subunit-like protein
MKLSKKLIDEVPLAILDTETTGLEPALGDRVIEIAILRLENWQEVGQINELINPGRPIPPSASRINKIYQADVANAPPFDHYAGRIAELLDGALVIAHNASFDAGFIATEWVLTGRPALLNPCACTLLLARKRFNFWRNSLGEVARALGVRTGRAHRAMNDVWTTSQVFQRMLRDLHQWNIYTVGDLMYAQGGPIYFPPPPPIELPSPLGAAVHSRTPIGIRYEDDDGRITERVIEPLYLGTYRGGDYLTAYCRTRNAQRTFRVDRILGAFSAY